MNIKLKHIQFTEVQYKVDTFDPNITTDGLASSLDMNVYFSPEEEFLNYFNVRFNLIIKKEGEIELSIKADAHFETDKNISKSDQSSPLLKINAPAIAFPYLRAFVSNLTMNSGYNPIILPTFNFVQMAQEKLD